MTTLFVSDLHLDDRRPETSRLFIEFLQNEAATADALYILGDLFEYWLGDDAVFETARQVANALSELTGSGVPCYFMHGNRDFLIRQAYADKTGMVLLPGAKVIDLYGERVLLLHGDSLCTDDVPFQQFRSIVLNPAWQDDFLTKTPAERLQVAMQARDASAEHKGNVTEGIMDVNDGEVIAAFERYGVYRMIHGHTHRPATHDLLINGKPAQRIVLGDWYSRGSVLRVSPGQFELARL